MKLDELFYALGDVAAGKRTLEDVCKEMAQKDKERFSKLFEAGKKFLSDLKTNVKQNVKDEIKKADIAAKYDTSSAVTVDVKGQKGYIGLKPKKKLPWWKQIGKNLADSMRNTADVLEGKKTLPKAAKDEVKRIDKSLSTESSVYRTASAAAKGTFAGVKKTIENLRGTSTPTPQPKAPDNPYETLDSEQLGHAMGVAYENIVRMDHIGGFTNSERDKALAEIQKIIDVAKKRFPDVKPEDKGAYFQHANVQSTEAELFAYMKADAAKNKDNIKQEDIVRYEAWRQSKDYELNGPTMTLKEGPFMNTARYGSAQWRNEAPQPHYKADEMLKSPLKSAKTIMTKQEIAEYTQRFSKINIR